MVIFKMHWSEKTCSRKRKSELPALMTGGEASLKLRMNLAAGVFVKEVKVGVLQASEGRPCGALIKAAFVNLLVVSSSEVRKIFPKVIRLDGAELPPPIVFDVSEEVKLPPYVVSFVCSPEGQQVAKQFLEQYFNIYDSDSRQAIGDAYHENAHFSLAITLPKGDGNHKLNQYMPDNRNLMRVRDANRRMKLLINGKENIVSKLRELPLTKHDLPSFTVDLPIFNPQLMFLNISGIFIERKLHLPTRYFSRTFVIVPLGGGFVIINDLLNITNATEKQAKAAFTKPVVETPVTSPVATPVVSPVASPPVATASVLPGVPVEPDDVKEQMVVAMCRQTTMNPLWSRKCLEENQWNFNAAVAVFTQLHSEQKVPPEAFVQ